MLPDRLPPLRERREDIPLLVRYFAQKFARRMNKRIETIPTEAMDALVALPLAGQRPRAGERHRARGHPLARASLEAPLAELKQRDGRCARRDSTTADDARGAEREHILPRARARPTGSSAAPTGAAAQLGMKRTTLQSKMRKLGIERPAVR